MYKLTTRYLAGTREGQLTGTEWDNLIVCRGSLFCPRIPSSSITLIKISLHIHITRFVIFTAMHGMQTRSSDEKAVRPSVGPSVKRVNCDKTEEISIKIFLPYEESFSLVF